ncbi:MAG: hypothetical protein SGJ18_12880 [Pseudomonadota bacterium]|nr:hypothetical protein [Pseudomonadota bacterium]
MVTRHLKNLIFFAFLVAIVACSKGDASKELLSISLTKIGFILPGNIVFGDTDICYPAATISEPRYYLSKMTTTWQGEGSFEPVIVKLEIPESGNITKDTCVFVPGSSGSSLAFALGFDSRTVTIGAADSITRDSICSFHCGGLQIKNKTASFVTTVRVKLIGIHTDINNVQRPVSASSTFSIQNIP